MSSTEKKVTYDLSPALHYPQAGKQGFTQAVTSGDTEQARLEAEPESPVPSQQTDMGTLISYSSMVSLCRQHLQRHSDTSWCRSFLSGHDLAGIAPWTLSSQHLGRPGDCQPHLWSSTWNCAWCVLFLMWQRGTHWEEWRTWAWPDSPSLCLKSTEAPQERLKLLC